MSQKKATDLITASAKDLARVSGKYPLNKSSIVNLKIVTLFVDIGALRVEIFILKV